MPSALHSLRHRLRTLAGRPDPFACEPAMEVIYRDLFRRELARIGEEDRSFRPAARPTTASST